MPDAAVQRTLWPAHAGAIVRSRSVFSSLAPALPSPVYDVYWRFAAERQAIFFRRFEGSPPPWTDDPILATFKFTNAYRASDRVSQYLIRNVIYCGEQTVREVFFRTLLFKLFNKIETWEMLCDAVGPISWRDYSYSAYDRVLSAAMSRRQAIYSAAYIMPTGTAATRTERKHQMHLRLLEQMIKDDLPERISDCGAMRTAFELLLGYPTIGEFLAYQFVTDLNYSTITDFTETEFVVPGPGAIDGIRKCFSTLGGLSEVDIIKVVAERQSAEFEARHLEFRSLWGRPLQLIDCQNLFCEVSKYSRVSHPDILGTSGRTRIKQKFQPIAKPIQYFYPPKWRIQLPICTTSRERHGD